MAHIPVSFGGGAGSGSDDCTAENKHVLAPYTAITKDSDDEPIPGGMTDNGAQTGTLNCDESITIKEGYHNGNGKITANSLASQTGATATAARILKGETAWVNGVKLTGIVEVSSIPSFSVAAYSTSQLTFNWKNPAAASGRPFSGVIICCKTGSYPTGPTDGFKYMGTGSNSAAGGTSSVTLSGFTAGTTYYCRIWAYCVCSAGNYTINSIKVLVSSGYVSATGKPTAAGSQTFKTSGIFTVPAGVRAIDVFLVGGGGGGGTITSGGTDARSAAGGGGSGYTATKKSIAVTPGETYAVTIGAGGAANNNGGDTSFGTLLTAAGGTTAIGVSSSDTLRKYKLFGGNGGSGGGRNKYTYDSGSESSSDYGDGGSDGGNGDGSGTSSNADSTSTDGSYGKGQGTTTRAFAETAGTLYAGGGGGGMGDSNSGAGAGGSGGGGAGADNDTVATAGTANTGGGGGGGSDASGYRTGGAGGSGICIIRWK